MDMYSNYPLQQVLTTVEAAKLLGVHPNTVRERVERCAMIEYVHYRRSSNGYLFTMESLKQFWPNHFK